MIAPNIHGQIGVVDEGIAVALRGLNAVVAVNLLLRNRILTVPFHEQHNAVFGHSEMRGGLERLEYHTSGTGSDTVGRIAVFGNHAEVSACKITFVIIARLEYRTG